MSAQSIPYSELTHSEIGHVYLILVEARLGLRLAPCDLTDGCRHCARLRYVAEAIDLLRTRL